MRKINRIYVHCSDTPDHLSIRAHHIRRWHMEDNGWSDIGYHLVVTRAGMVEKGRPFTIPGAGVRGRNKNSIHICWIGRDHIEGFQKAQLLTEIATLIITFGLTVHEVLGHYEDDSSKTCPNLDMNQIRKEIQGVLDDWLP